MTQYAYFDFMQPDPKPVLGWYDTEVFRYPNLPDTSNLLEMSPNQWATRQDGLWAVEGGNLVPYSPPIPAPSIAQQAVALQAGGLAVSSSSDSALDATYPCDSLAQQHVSAEVVSLLLNGTFTDGATTISWLDVEGNAHELSIDQFKALATAIAVFVTGCARCASGQSTTLPSNAATISPSQFSP
jgi:hypothetical protein